MATYQSLPSSATLHEQVPMLSEQSAEKNPNVVVKEVSIASDYSKEDLTLKPLSYRRSINLAHPKTANRPLPLDQFFKACASQAPFLKAIVITFITGVPFLVFLLITLYALPKNTKVGPPGSEATIFELSKWLLISWASFIGLLWCGRILAAISTWCCTLSRSWIKFQRLVEAICLRMVLMLWAAICYAIIPDVFHHSLGTQDVHTVENWVQTLQKVFKFLIIAFAVIFVQGVVLELSSIQYIQGWMGPRSQRACDELDTIKKLHELTNPHLTADNAGYVTKILKKLLLPVGDNDLFYQISRGQGHPEMWTEYANHIWDSISQSKAAVTRFDIDEQLRVMNRDPARGQELFTQLDESCDGQVTLSEMEKLVQRVGLQLNTRAQAQHGIYSLLRKLEIILSIVTGGIISFIYIQSFEVQYSKDLGMFWTGLTGLSFAFGGVLLEFTNACVFVFGKHPYDVGDYVESKGKKLVVNKIFLTHTNFEEVIDPEERGTVVQISHASLMAEPIVNWTRTLEAVVEKKNTKAKADEIKEKEKAEGESKEKEEARELILLKTARLKNVGAKGEIIT